METIEIAIGIVALSLLAVVWLGIYLFGLYSLAKLVGTKTQVRRHKWVPYAIIAATSAVLSSFIWFVPVDNFTRLCFFGVLWIVHMHPFSVGFWVSQDTTQRRDQASWWRKTEEWLSEWEEKTKP